MRFRSTCFSFRFPLQNSSVCGEKGRRKDRSRESPGVQYLNVTAQCSSFPLTRYQEIIEEPLQQSSQQLSAECVQMFFHCIHTRRFHVRVKSIRRALRNHVRDNKIRVENTADERRKCTALNAALFLLSVYRNFFNLENLSRHARNALTIAFLLWTRFAFYLKAGKFYTQSKRSSKN